MSKNDGGPAFPQAAEYDKDGQLINFASTGMTLRDYLAAAVATGREAISDQRTYSNRAYHKPEYAALSLEEWQEAIMMDDARYCYRMADALLKVR